jgi:hypothetical protein
MSPPRKAGGKYEVAIGDVSESICLKLRLSSSTGDRTLGKRSLCPGFLPVFPVAESMGSVADSRMAVVQKGVQPMQRSLSRLLVAVIGLRNSGKSHTWNTLFGRTVRTGKHDLDLSAGEFVETFLIAGSPEERELDVEDILDDQQRRIVLCSMQYLQGVQNTLDYFAKKRFLMYIQWLNPARGRQPVRTFDDLGLTLKMLSLPSLLSIRDGNVEATSRVEELREFIYGWARFNGLIRQS